MVHGRVLGALLVSVAAIGLLAPSAAAHTAQPAHHDHGQGHDHDHDHDHGPPPALFAAGAAIGNITPPMHGQAGTDPADCAHAASFDGPRTFAFEEPYADVAHTGHFAPGDAFVDCNHNGRWDGILLGGGADTPRFASRVADRVTARALVVSNRDKTIAIEVLDQEGVFNIYQERIRAQVAKDGYHFDGIFVSATHDESAPDTLGISGVEQTTSGVDAYYVDFMVRRSAHAIEDAYNRRRLARVKYAEAIEPANLRQCWSSYPFVDDQLMPSLQAVGLDGRVIATLGNVSQHTETLGFNPDPDQRLWISSDWAHFFRQSLEQRFGGIGIEMAGSVGSNETPEVFSAPISRTPQQFVNESHPAGCRTLFDANGTQTPVGYDTETTQLGRQLAGAIGDALSTSGSWSQSDEIWGARRSVCITLGNDLFRIGAQLGVFAARPGYDDNCTVQNPVSPSGQTSGAELKSDVAAFRIGDGEFASVPGEVFPFTFLRGFLGPEDMPKPQYAMPPWVVAHMHARYRFVDGLAEDMLGYIFPRGNGVGVIGEDGGGDDTDRFGCGHSDDSESTTALAGDVVGTGLVHVLDKHEGGPEDIQVGRYVLPDGTHSRNPLGRPASIKCDVDTTFTATGPATAIWLPGAPNGRVVYPAAWMSLSGRAQRHPDRNTRGWIDRHGVRHWLDVFPDVSG